MAEQLTDERPAPGGAVAQQLSWCSGVGQAGLESGRLARALELIGQFGDGGGLFLLDELITHVDCGEVR
ncbi:MAG: hypothetical protein ABIV07_11820, partial [Polaromonas sp.]